ncbi:MAG TPA: hypothetical protein VGG60_13605 [Candidatus Binataceae bacterium]|jgi:hypothetical protein
MAVNDTLLVIGYGSLLSGYGMLAERRGGKSRLVARDAFPVRLLNARRGLAKPSSHGHYLAMDLEPIEPTAPISAHAAAGSNLGIGALGLVFDREWAPLISRREEYDEHKFVELIGLADRAGKPLGEFLHEIAHRTAWNLLDYRRALFDLLGYTSEGYIFHPIPLSDGRIAVAAIGSGFEGSGDSAVRSKRSEYGMDRLLTLSEALRVESFDLDRDGQIGYFVECLLGGFHGLEVADLTRDLDPELHQKLIPRFHRVVDGERERFLIATSLDEPRYRGAFGDTPHAALHPFLGGAAKA